MDSLKNKFASEVAFVMDKIVEANVPITKMAQAVDPMQSLFTDTSKKEELPAQAGNAAEQLTSDISSPALAGPRMQQTRTDYVYESPRSYDPIAARQETKPHDPGLSLRTTPRAPVAQSQEPQKIPGERIGKRPDPWAPTTYHAPGQKPSLPVPSGFTTGTPASVGPTPTPVPGPTPAQQHTPFQPLVTQEPTTASAQIIDTIQKIANYLGEVGDYRSEMIADQLLDSVIADFTKSDE